MIRFKDITSGCSRKHSLASRLAKYAHFGQGSTASERMPTVAAVVPFSGYGGLRNPMGQSEPSSFRGPVGAICFSDERFAPFPSRQRQSPCCKYITQHGIAEDGCITTTACSYVIPYYYILRLTNNNRLLYSALRNGGRKMKPSKMLSSFMQELSEGFSKPMKGYVWDMLFGISVGRSAMLSEIGRSLSEEADLITTEMRLSRNLESRHLG